MQIENMPIVTRCRRCDAIRFDPTSIDADRLGVVWRTGNEPSQMLEMPTLGLNGRVGAAGLLGQDAQVGPY
jgi:hypothetical protein